MYAVDALCRELSVEIGMSVSLRKALLKDTFLSLVETLVYLGFGALLNQLHVFD